MTQSDHIIGRIKIQLDVPDREKVEFFFEMLSKLASEKLPALINTVFDELQIPADTHLRLDNLLIDVGILQEATFEQDLIRQLKAALSKDLKTIQHPTPADFNIISTEKQSLNLLEFLLELGHFPWWANAQERTETTIESLWLEMLKNGSTETRRQMKKLLHLRTAQMRFMLHVSPQTIRLSVLNLLKNDRDDTIFRFLEELTYVVKNLYPNYPIEKEIWQTGLIQVLQNPPGETSLQSLWTIQNQQLAIKIATPTKNLMERLLASFKERNQLPLGPFIMATKRFPAENFPPKYTDGQMPETEPESIQDQSFSQISDGAVFSSTGMDQGLRDFLQQFPETARQLLLEMFRQKDGSFITGEQIKSGILQETLDILFPTLAPEIRSIIQGIIKRIAALYPQQDISQQIWQNALKYLLEHPVFPVSKKDFLNALIPDMAKSLTVPIPVMEQLLDRLPKKDMLNDAAKTDISEPEEKLNLEEKAPTASPLEQFRYYLESGQLTERGGLTAAALEENFLSFSNLFPQKARQLLLEMNQKLDLATQLSRLFDTKMLMAVVEVLYPDFAPRLSAFIQAFSSELGANYPGRAVESLLWKNALSFLLAHPESPGSVRSIAESSVLSMANYLGAPPEEIHRILVNLSEISSVEGIEQDAVPGQKAAEKPMEPINSPDEQVFYFLEWSRLPKGASMSMAALEKAYWNQLENDPARSRQLLLALNVKLNLAARLNQHFSLKSIQKTIQTIFPGSWKDLTQVLDDVTKLPFTGKKTKETSDQLIWETTLQILLNAPSESVNFPALLQRLVSQLRNAGMVYLETPISRTSISTLRKAGFNSVTIQYLLQAFGEMKDSEQKALEEEMDQWQKENLETNVASRSAKTALDTILYRLEHMAPAWWDDAQQSEDTLVYNLTQASEQELRTALQAIWSVPFREKWLPLLSDKTIHRIFQVLWTDYANISLLMLQVFKAAALEFGFNIDTGQIQMALLRRAQMSYPINSKQIFQLILQSALDQSKQPEQLWRKALLYKTDIVLTSGDIRYHRIRELVAGLEEPSEQPVPKEKKAEIQDEIPKDAATADRLTYADLLKQDIAILNQFLQFGTLPAPGNAFQHVDALEQLLIRLMDKHGSLVSPILIQAFVREDNALRFSQVFSTKALHATAALLWQSHITGMLELWSQLLDRLQESNIQIERPRINRHLFSYVFHLAGAIPQTAYKDLTFTEGLVRMIAEKEGIPIAILLEQLRIPKPGFKPKSIDLLLDQIFKTLEQAVRKDAFKQTESERIQESPISVTNAGLVILAPYLPRYFGTLNLLDGKQFKDDAAAERGVHLLQYLASNQKETPEHLLIFNKVLCGMPVNTVIGLGFEPTEAEMELSDFLLNTVLQNWEMMKNSTISNLQGAFLLREGLLREKEDKWQLHVVPKAFDIVLEYLPWTISQIMLPWMHKRIEVEWKKKT